MARDADAGLDAVRRAVALNPGSGFVSGLASAALVFGGEPEDAVIHVERAMALSPLDPSLYMFQTVAGLAHLFAGRPGQALDLARKSLALYDWDSVYWVLIPAYVQLGRIAEAQAGLAKLQSLSPGMTVSGIRQRMPIKNPLSLEMILEGLQKAGLPA